MVNLRTKQKQGWFLAISALIFMGSLFINVKYSEPKEVAAGDTGTEQSDVQKVSYEEILPAVLDVSEEELDRIKSLAESDVSAAAEEMKTYEDALLIPVLRELLNIYYADAHNPDMEAINTLKEALQDRMDNIFAGYDAALEERLNVESEKPGYLAGRVTVYFGKSPSYEYEDIQEVAVRIGASVYVLEYETLEDYIEADAYGGRPSVLTFRLGIGMSNSMAIEILEQIDCVERAWAFGVDYTQDETEIETNETEDLAKAETKESDFNTDVIQSPDKETAATIQKGTVYTVSGLQYKVLDADTKEVSLVGSRKKNITKLNMKGSVTIEGTKCKIVSVGNSAFMNAQKLSQITLGKNIISIGKNAFAGCSNLKQIQIKGSKLKSVKKNAFRNINPKAVIRAPKKKLAAYRQLLKI